MKKLTYIILSLCLCTAGIGTAAHFSPAHTLADSLAVINDTIDTDEEEVSDDEEDEEDEEWVEITDDEEDEEDAVEEGDDEEDDEDAVDEEDEDDEDEGDEDEYDEDEDDEEDSDFGFFTEEEEEEFGQMHEDDDDEEEEDLDDEYDEEEEDDGLELTEGMRISVDDQLEGYTAKNYLSSDSPKTEVESKDATAEEYIARLRRMPVLMEMPYNDVVGQYINRYVKRMRRSVSYFLGAQNFYNPIFEDALEAEGCPLELKYLPIIESAYNPSATSPVGAAGLWQFMPSTAKSNGLEINSLVDERRDPIKSTKAAAKYLKTLYGYYNDWNLAIAAYNCGPGNVNKAIQRAGGTKDYWAIYNYLPHETRGYVPAFIAANYAMYYYCEHGIEPMQAKLPAATDTVMVSRDLHLKQVAELCDVDIDLLRDLNPQYRQQIVPGYWRTCSLRLPTEAVSKFIALGDSVYNYEAATLLPNRSTAKIAQTSGSTTRTTARSSSQSTAKPAATRTNTASTTKSNGYRKQGYSKQGYSKGYTKQGYSKQGYSKQGYGKTGYTKNGYSKSGYSKQGYSKQGKGKATTTQKGKGTAKTGGKQTAKGKGTAKPKAKPAPSTVTIQKGDNLSTIAKRHGTTVDKLKKLNGMKGKDTKIQTGKKLKVK